MTIKTKIKSHSDEADYFKELSLHNNPIKKPKITRLKKINLLSELSFYEELNIIKANHDFRGYAMSYKVETVERKDLTLQ